MLEVRLQSHLSAREDEHCVALRVRVVGVVVVIGGSNEARVTLHQMWRCFLIPWSGCNLCEYLKLWKTVAQVVVVNCLQHLALHEHHLKDRHLRRASTIQHVLR